MKRVAVSNHKQVVGLKPEKAIYETAVKGVRGLTVRTFPSGAKHWEFRYVAPNGKRPRMPLGEFPSVSLAAATSRANVLRAKVTSHQDPAAEVAMARALARTGDTLSQLTDAWLAASRVGDHGGRKKGPKSLISIANEESRFRIHIAPVYGARRFKDISRSELRQFMAGLVERQKLSPATVCSIGATLSGVFGYAVHKELLESNPMDGRTRPLDTVARDRMFDDNALKVLWCALSHNDGVSPITALAVEFLCLTMSRRASVAGAKWQEMNFAEKSWTIPGFRHKSQKNFVVPICPNALETLQEAAKLIGGPNAKVAELSGFVFPSPRIEGAALSPYSINQAIGRICADKGLPHGSAHDLRRTASTLLAKVGKVDQIMIDRVLAQSVATKLQKTYNMYEYFDEKKEVLGVWEKILSKIVATPKAREAKSRKAP